MKAPNDMASRAARLRSELVDAFMSGDSDTFGRVTRELEVMLRQAGVPRARNYERRVTVAGVRKKRLGIGS